MLAPATALFAFKFIILQIILILKALSWNIKCLKMQRPYAIGCGPIDPMPQGGRGDVYVRLVQYPIPNTD